ncbi:MAG TPA: CHAT domain-containing protein, partial [Longimicrobiales bacterium]
MAQFYAASAYLDLGHTFEALTLLNDIERSASSSYRALRAELLAMHAAYAAKGGANAFALESYRAAADAFTALGEEQRATHMHELTANVLRNSGAVSEAWPLRHSSLVSATGLLQEWQIARIVYSMAIDAIAEERWDVGYALLNVVSEMRTCPHDADTWRIIAAQRGGMPRTAAVHHAKARDGNGADLAIVEALTADDGGDAVRLLTKALETATLTGATPTRIQLLLERAKALRTAGQLARAEADLNEATALMNERVFITPQRDAVLPGSALADSLFTEPDIRGETLRAIHASERAQFEQSATTFPIPAHTTVIVYGVFEDRIVIHALDERGRHSAEVKVGPKRVRELVANLGHDTNIGPLSRILIWPIEKALVPGNRIVFVLDRDLRLVPFTALQKANGRHLIQDHTVTADTSITAFLRAQRRQAPLSSRALLAVGNPICDNCEESLPQLSGAEAEAREVAEMYVSRVTLVREDATKERGSGALQYCDAAHFAVHAKAGLGDVVPPHLLLA